MRGKGFHEKGRAFVYGRLRRSRVMTRSYRHSVGAYGVVGFSGVKDARRESSLPTLQRRLQIQRKPSAPSVQSRCSSVAILVQDLNRVSAK